MKRDLAIQLSSLSVGLGLFAIYVVFLNNFLAMSNLSDMTTIETVILYTQILRVVILFLVGLRYQIQPIVPIVVFSIEALLIPPLLVLIILTGESSFYTAFMGVLLTAWFGADALILEPYAIYRFALTLVKEMTVTAGLTLAAFELITVLFLSTLLSGVTQPIQGLSGLGMQIISEIRTDLQGGGVPNPTGDVLTSFGLILFFVGIVFYTTFGSYSVRSKLRLPWMLIVAFAGVIVAFVWIGLVSQSQSDVLAVLSLPSFALLALIWATSRGK
ncbi:MAG TPA: hypothetical protein VED17_01790 [Nitrososphaerales archaeon]|nr:hypothetical protein [Nitrososphaerales archaeon]